MALLVALRAERAYLELPRHSQRGLELNIVLDVQVDYESLMDVVVGLVESRGGGSTEEMGQNFTTAVYDHCVPMLKPDAKWTLGHGSHKITFRHNDNSLSRLTWPKRYRAQFRACYLVSL